MHYSKQALIICAILGFVLLLAAGTTYYLVIKNNSAVNEETRRIFADSPTKNVYIDLNGNPVSLEQFLGKTLVVTAWASWSPFSSEDLINLNQIAKDLNNNEVIFIAINRKESREQAQRYAATLPELENVTLVIDQEDRFYNSIGGYAMPETVVFNSQGIVVEHVRGQIKAETITAAISRNLIVD